MKTIKIIPTDRGGMSVLIDGIDVGPFVHQDGMMIEFRKGVAYVTLPLSPGLLSAYLPAAVVNALGPDPDPEHLVH